MAKVSLGKAPKNFKKQVTFKMLDGTDGTIECVFKYRTVKQYGEMKDELSRDAATPDAASESFWAQFMEKRSDKSAELLALILEGWNLDEEFSQANLKQLAEELPGAVQAIAEAYELAVVQGRLGN